MKKLSLIFASFFIFFGVLSNVCFAQSVYSNKDTSAIKTEIFWIDMHNPNSLTSVMRTNGTNKYEIKWKNNFIFAVKNLNQYKYNYSINSVPFGAYVDTNYNLKTTSVNSVFSSSLSNFYQAQQYQNSFQNKKLIQIYLDSLDIYESRIADIDRLLIVEKDPKKSAKDLQEYGKNVRSFNKLSKKLKDLAVIFDLKKQAEAIKNIADKLMRIEDNCKEVGMMFSDRQTLKDLKQEIDNFTAASNSKRINNKYSYNSEGINYYVAPLTLSNGNINQIGGFYYRTVIITSHYLKKFEMLYDSLDNICSHVQSSAELKDKEKILQKIGFFNDVREVFLDLKDFYTYYEMDIPYVSYLNIQMDNLQQQLFKNFNNISKAINFSTIYIIPTWTNMKNIDQLNITLSVTDRVTNKSQNYDYDIFLKGGLKFDFSAGFFGSTLKNDTYVTTAVLDKDDKPTDHTVIRSVNNGNMDVGFGGMVNITLRRGASWFAPGISFGLNLSSQPSFQFLSAGTLSIGKTERILLHAGYAAGFVKRIDGLPLNESLPSIKVGDVVPTIDRFLIRPFVGITYNLSKNNVFKVTTFKNASSEPAK